MGRSPCCDETGLKKGPWTPEEDKKLINHIKKHGHGSWRALPKLAGLNRCGKSCRLRWTNYLRPDIKRGNFSQEEEQTILNLHAILGNKWSAIATHLSGRTDNEIKNFWNTHLKKKLIQMGYDPITHRPRTNIFNSLPHLIALAKLKELVEHNHSPWEGQQAAIAMRSLESEVATLQYLHFLLQPPTNMPANIPNIEAYNNNNNLLNSMKDDQIIIGNNSVNNIIPPPNSFTSLQDSIPLSHLPELQNSSSFHLTTSLDNKDMINTTPTTTSTSPWQLPPPSSSSQAVVATNDHQNSSINIGEGDIINCTTTTPFFGGAHPNSVWPDILLEDSFFHDITT